MQGRPRGRHLGGRPAPRLRAPRGARHPRRRAAAREGRGPLQGPADRARRRRGRGDRAGARSRRSRSTSRSGPALFDVRKAADPDAPQIHHWGNWYPHFEAEMDVRQIRKGDIDAAFDQADTIVSGVYRPAAIEQLPLETQIALVVPEPSGRLTIYSCTQALYFSMGVVAAHLEWPLNRLKFVGGTVGGGFGGKVDTAAETVSRARRAEVRPPGEVALDARGGVPLLVDPRAVAHGDRRRGHEGRLDPRPQDADAPRLGRVRALLAVRRDEAQLPPHRRVHDPEPALRRLRRLHEPRADDGDARLRRHVGLVRDRDCTSAGSPRCSASTRSSCG